MNINSITSGNASTDASIHQKTNQKKEYKEATQSFTESDSAVVYEASKTEYTSNSKLIEKLKSDSEARVNQFKKLVEDMFAKQGKVFKNADDIWKSLASGDFTVDEETAKKASKDIAEDGYWGVEQTSERIFSFAKALSGEDPEKMQDMLDAFKKGFEDATSAWGKELPEISQKTYDAVLKKFEEFNNQK